MRRMFAAVNLWDCIATAGAALLGGGIWSLWGAPWASIFWGALLLAMATLHAVLTPASRSEG